MRDYTVRHAVWMTVGLGAGTVLWVGFCVALALPWHPWATGATGVLVAGALFCFAMLDAAAVRALSSLRGLWSVLLLVCVGLAAVLGRPGGPFPIWALIPLLVCGGAMGAAVTYFGMRSIVRVVVGRTPPAEPGAEGRGGWER